MTASLKPLKPAIMIACLVSLAGCAANGEPTCH